MRTFLFGVAVVCALSSSAGCAGSADDSPSAKSPNATPQKLSFSDPCNYESCGTVPSSMKDKPVLHCESNGEDNSVDPSALKNCEWNEEQDDDDQTVSARHCEVSECGAKPQVACPAGAHFVDQTCIDEDNAGCRWQTVCAAKKQGRACNTHADCPSGVCEGQGCGELEGVCLEIVGSLACSDDARPFCGCDGKTFRSSSSCVGERYAHPGECQ